MFTKLHNIVIAVKDVEQATKLYTDTYDFQVSRAGFNPQTRLKNAIFPIGDATIELVQPFDPEERAVTKFLQNRGEGLYMLEFEVESIDSAIQLLRAKGVRLLGDDPESRAKGGLVFIHPQSTRGVLIMLVQKTQ